MNREDSNNFRLIGFECAVTAVVFFTSGYQRSYNYIAHPNRNHAADIKDRFRVRIISLYKLLTVFVFAQ